MFLLTTQSCTTTLYLLLVILVSLSFSFYHHCNCSTMWTSRLLSHFDLLYCAVNRVFPVVTTPPSVILVYKLEQHNSHTSSGYHLLLVTVSLMTFWLSRSLVTPLSFRSLWHLILDTMVGTMLLAVILLPVLCLVSIQSHIRLSIASMLVIYSSFASLVVSTVRLAGEYCSELMTSHLIHIHNVYQYIYCMPCFY